MASSTRVYLVVLLIMTSYAGAQILSKAAFNRGVDTFVFTFYRTAFGSLFLIPIALLLERKKVPPLSLKVSFKIFMQALYGIAAPTNLFMLGLKFSNTTPTSALFNLIPVTTFVLALLFGMEKVNLKRLHGIMKVTGVLLCFAGVVVLAFYSGPELKPINHHHINLYHANPSHDHGNSRHYSNRWALGVLYMTLATTCWSLWQVFQGPLLKDYPSKLLNASLQSIFGYICSSTCAIPPNLGDREKGTGVFGHEFAHHSSYHFCHIMDIFGRNCSPRQYNWGCTYGRGSLQCTLGEKQRRTRLQATKARDRGTTGTQ
ncbi:WAT1-related protein At5g64700-like isoform X3 [Carex rostrata]